MNRKEKTLVVESFKLMTDKELKEEVDNLEYFLTNARNILGMRNID